MRTIELLSIFLLVGLLNTMCRAQSATLTPYSELTGFEKGKVLRNEITGYMDTTLVYVSGKIFDNKDELIPTAEILISTDEQQRTEHANLNGEYGIWLEPGNYELTFQLAGMDTINVDGLDMDSGQRRNIDVSLGLAGTLTHYLLENKQ